MSLKFFFRCLFVVFSLLVDAHTGLIIMTVWACLCISGFCGYVCAREKGAKAKTDFQRMKYAGEIMRLSDTVNANGAVMAIIALIYASRVWL